MNGVRLLVKSTVWFVGEFYVARDGGVVGAVAGVVWAVDREAVDEQVHPLVEEWMLEFDAVDRYGMARVGSLALWGLSEGPVAVRAGGEVDRVSP